MRKVKAAALVLCFATAGLLGGFTVNDIRDIPAAGTLRYETLEMTRSERSGELSERPEGLTSPAGNTGESGTAPALITEAAARTAETSVTRAKATGTATTTTGQSAKPSARSVQESHQAAGRPAAALPATEHTVTAATTTTTTAAMTTTTVTMTETTADTTVTTTAAATTAETTVQETEETTAVTVSNGYAVSVTEREYIMLCNVVGHEYGSDFVPEAEKALVVEVIMNRVNSPLFPNTIHEVLTQKNQFAGIEYYIELPEFSDMVTDSVKAAVDLYLTDPSKFQHGYYYFNGDGTRNYFRGL